MFTSSHPHMFTYSHLFIFTSSHLHKLTPSHTYIFTSSHLHILTSSHLHILTNAHLHTSSHIFSLSLCLSHSSPSHLHIKIVGIFRRLRPAENVLELWKFKVGKASERFLQAISSIDSEVPNPSESSWTNSSLTLPARRGKMGNFRSLQCCEKFPSVRL